MLSAFWVCCVTRLGLVDVGNDVVRHLSHVDRHSGGCSDSSEPNENLGSDGHDELGLGTDVSGGVDGRSGVINGGHDSSLNRWANTHYKACYFRDFTPAKLLES